MNTQRLDELRASLKALQAFGRTMKLYAETFAEAQKNYAEAIAMVEAELASLLAAQPGATDHAE